MEQYILTAFHTKLECSVIKSINNCLCIHIKNYSLALIFEDMDISEYFHEILL